MGLDVEVEPESYRGAPVSDADVDAAAEPMPGVFCNQCGWRNPLGARFCSRCGSAVQDLEVAGADVPIPAPASAVAETPTPNKGTFAPTVRDSRTMSLLITAGAVLLVLVLYAVTAVSKDMYVQRPQASQQPAVDAGATGGLPVVPRELQMQADAMRADADALSGADRAARLAEVVNLYLTRGFYQEAARAQSEVAEVLGTAQAWADAGNLGYRAMQESEGTAKITYAQQAIDAYGRSLELDPENLDVRTDMATAYLATNNPMEGVRQIRQVLETNPNHVQANFNYGVMLSMIGQTTQSIDQFERVRSLVDPGTDTYRQAELALQELRAR